MSDVKPYWTDADGTMHEIYTANIFIENAWYGSFQYDSGRADIRWHRSGFAYFCFSCGDIWARVVVTDSNNNSQGFTLCPARCEKHGDGSLLQPLLTPLWELFPEPFMRKEFIRLLKEYE